MKVVTGASIQSAISVRMISICLRPGVDLGLFVGEEEEEGGGGETLCNGGLSKGK